MIRKKKLKILFFGNFNKPVDVEAYNLIKKSGSAITKVDTRSREDKITKKILNWKGDYIFHLFSYSKLSLSLLKNAKIASINFHPSLPKYPGSGGLTWSLMNNDKYFGVTVHFMNEKIDNGKIIFTIKSKIKKKDNIQSLIHKTDKIKLKTFKFTFNKIIKNEYDKILSLSKKNYKIKWSKKIYKISEIDIIQKIHLNVNKKSLRKIIRATLIYNYLPYIELHGFKFFLKK